MTNFQSLASASAASLARLESLLAQQKLITDPGHLLLKAIADYAKRHPEENLLARCAVRSGVLIRQGQPVPAVYALVDGQLEVSQVRNGKNCLLALLAPPALVGEIARIAGVATATVSVPKGRSATLLAIPQEEFTAVLQDSPDTWKHYQNLVSGRCLQQLPEGNSVAPQLVRALLKLVCPADADEHRRGILARMAEDIILNSPDIFGWRAYQPGDTLIREGEPLDSVFVIIRGVALVQKPHRPDISVGPGSLLGEMSALSGRLPTASVVAGNAGVEVLYIPRADFQEKVLNDATTRAKVRELALLRLTQQYEGERLDRGTEERLRIVRDQNTDALIRRQGIRAVAGQGVFHRLNPGGGRLTINGREHDSIEQKYLLLAASEALLKCGWSREDILDAAGRIRQQSIASSDDEQGASAAALRSFIEYVDHFESIWREQLAPARPEALATPTFRSILERTRRIRWLQAKVREDPLVDACRLPTSPLEQHLASIAGAPDPAAVLDQEFRTVMELGTQQGSEKLFRELCTVMFEKVELDLDHFDAQNSAPLSTRETCDNNYRHLAHLREELDRGEVSAIGGAEYPLQRFSRAVLEAVAAGEITVVVYDGEADAAERFVRTKYGTDPATGAIWHGVATQIQGLDGSGPRTLLTIKKPAGVAHYLIIAGYGEARQLHNAGAVLLYESSDGRRIPVRNLELVLQGLDYIGRLRNDIRQALKVQAVAWEGADILGGAPGTVQSLVTQLVILQNPTELLGAFGPEHVILEPADGALLRFYTGFLRLGKSLLRLIVPKVGGDGLYGDMAGHFVTATFTSGIEQLNRSILFNGTAGGFSCTAGRPEFRGARGLGDIRPGGVIIPLDTIEQVDDEVGPMPLRTLFGSSLDPDKTLASWLARVGMNEPIHVNFTSHHAAVPAPAVETYRYIEEKLVQQQKASVDVEGGRIWQAVEQLRDLSITFTPVYTHSDDPRNSRENPSESLANMGPWFEGVEHDAKKYWILKALLAAAQVEDGCHLS